MPPYLDQALCSVEGLGPLGSNSSVGRVSGRRVSGRRVSGRMVSGGRVSGRMVSGRMVSESTQLKREKTHLNK